MVVTGVGVDRPVEVADDRLLALDDLDERVLPDEQRPGDAEAVVLPAGDLEDVGQRLTATVVEDPHRAAVDQAEDRLPAVSSAAHVPRLRGQRRAEGAS